MSNILTSEMFNGQPDPTIPKRCPGRGRNGRPMETVQPAANNAFHIQRDQCEGVAQQHHTPSVLSDNAIQPAADNLTHPDRVTPQSSRSCNSNTAMTDKYDSLPPAVALLQTIQRNAMLVYPTPLPKVDKKLNNDLSEGTFSRMQRSFTSDHTEKIFDVASCKICAAILQLARERKTCAMNAKKRSRDTSKSVEDNLKRKR